MHPLLGAFALPASAPIHTTSFVLQDYLPAAAVALVVIVLAAAIAIVAIRRKNVR